MAQILFYGGIDVDDKSFHVAVLDKQSKKIGLTGNSYKKYTLYSDKVQIFYTNTRRRQANEHGRLRSRA